MTDQHKHEALSLGEKINRLIHDPFGSVVAAVVLCSAATAMVFVGINAIGTVV